MKTRTDREREILGEALSCYLKYLTNLATSKVNEKKFNTTLDIAEKLNIDVPLHYALKGKVREGNTPFYPYGKVPYAKWVEIPCGTWEDLFLAYKDYTRERKDNG